MNADVSSVDKVESSVSGVSGDDSQLDEDKRLYLYRDDPLPGWTKEVKVSLSVKNCKPSNKGNVTVGYYAPGERVAISSEAEIKQKLYENKLCDTKNYLKMFCLRKPYCVCHSDHHRPMEMVDCKYGKAGCNGKFHPSCMGRLLGDYGPDGIEWPQGGTMGFVCPLCTEFLKSTASSELMLQHKFLKAKDIEPKPANVEIVDGWEVKEFKEPFTSWGIVGENSSNFLESMRDKTQGCDGRYFTVMISFSNQVQNVESSFCHYIH